MSLAGESAAHAEALARICATTFGPPPIGAEHAVCDRLGNIVLTGSGHQVLQSLHLAHPVQRILLQGARRAERQAQGPMPQ